VCPSRRCNSVSIEIARDRPRRPPSGVVSENAPDDLGLLENFELAATSGDDLIAIGPAACVPPGADNAGHAAAHLLGAVFHAASAR